MRVGPLAYVISGFRAMRGRRTRVSLTLDDEPPLRRRTRTVVVGNSGTLLGGLVLMPRAAIDDGVLDVVNIAPSTLVGWLAVAVRVITRRRRGHERVEHWQAKSIVIESDAPQPSQLDGDPIGEAAELADPGRPGEPGDAGARCPPTRTPPTRADAARAHRLRDRHRGGRPGAPDPAGDRGDEPGRRVLHHRQGRGEGRPGPAAHRAAGPARHPAAPGGERAATRSATGRPARPATPAAVADWQDRREAELPADDRRGAGRRRRRRLPGLGRPGALRRHAAHPGPDRRPWRRSAFDVVSVPGHQQRAGAGRAAPGGAEPDRAARSR